jgi:hypothetical protein
MKWQRYKFRNFTTPSWLKVTLVVVVSLLLIASIVGLWRAYAMPETVAQEVALVTYRHFGNFDGIVYVTPSYLLGNPPETSQDETESSLYFTNIIDDIQVGFDYNFVPDSPTVVSSQVEVVAIITGPSKWQKTIPLTSASGLGNHFNISFPLDLDEIDEMINTIEVELGFRRPESTVQNSYSLVIEARVKVNGSAGSEQINDTFVQTTGIEVVRGTLEWDNQLFLSERETHSDFSYRHQGSFDYTIRVKQNSLYPSQTLTSDLYSPPSLIRQQWSGEVIYLKLTDIMKTNFSYKFRCDKPVRNLVEELQVTASLEFTDVWTKTFILVPDTQESGDFEVEFYLDVNFFKELTDTIMEEIGMGPSSHQLTIEAVVHTSADTDFGRIDDVFTQTMTGELGTTVITWDEELESSKSGSISQTQVISNPDKLIGLSVSGARSLFIYLTSVIAVLCLFGGILYVIRGPAKLPEIEEEARRAKRKYKDLIVDVQELPEVKDAVVVPLDSLDGLVTTAQGLFKPVLHQVETGRHTYCVLDAMIRYEYVSEEKPPASRKRALG